MGRQAQVLPSIDATSRKETECHIPALGYPQKFPRGGTNRRSGGVMQAGVPATRGCRGAAKRKNAPRVVQPKTTPVVQGHCHARHASVYCGCAAKETSVRQERSLGNEVKERRLPSSRGPAWVAVGPSPLVVMGLRGLSVHQMVGQLVSGAPNAKRTAERRKKRTRREAPSVPSKKVQRAAAESMHSKNQKADKWRD